MSELKKKRLERYKKRLEMYYDLEKQVESLEAAGGKNKAGRFIPRDL